MGYLYGDATPFPYDENFIETLSALTDACVALFQAENGRTDRQRNADEARARAEAELAQVHQLGQAFQQVLQPFLHGASPAGTAAGEIAGLIKNELKKAADSIGARRDVAVRQAAGVDLTKQVRDACSIFFIKHQLPNTSWGVEWAIPAGGETPDLLLYGYAPENIRMKFVGTIPGDSMWADAIKISDLEDELNITTSQDAGLLRKGTKKEQLHRMFLTGVRYTPGRYHLTVKHSTKKPSAGMRFALKDGGRPVPSVVKLNAAGEDEGQPESLDPDSAAAVTTLWRDVKAQIGELSPMRTSLLGLRFGAKRAEDCAEPRALAETLLALVAPIVIEIRKRSRVPGELGLKRELGDGRREEIFMQRDELTKRFSGLPDHQQRVFEAMGLSMEPTAEFAQTHLPRAKGDTLVSLEEALDIDVD